MKFICPNCHKNVNLNICVNNIISINATLLKVLYDIKNLEIICPNCKERSLFKEFKEIKEE